MDPTRKARPTAAGPTAPRHTLPDDAIVAYLRAHAPDLPTPRSDARAVTSRARGALRRRRLRHSVMAIAGAATAYLTLALAGPLPVPGLGTASVPGGDALQAMVGDFFPVGPPGPDRRQADVDRLETNVLPIAEELELSYYLLEPGPCRILEYRRGDFSDPQCEELAPFDAEARADFDEVTDALDRSGVAVERIFAHVGGIYVQLKDHSWRYNWQYVYLPDVGSPPATTGRPGEEWMHIRGDWWFHRTQDD
jgi:hypothetical protein